MNKIIITISLIIGFITTQAQVGVEVNSVRGNGLMDFPLPANKGIILPKNNGTTSTVAGSMVFNVNSQQVEYYDDNPISTGWVAMTNSTSGVESDLQTTSTQIGKATVENGSGTIVTDISLADNAQAEGVLELRSDSKALILPTVLTANDLPDGRPGMICYIQEDKTMAIFNGEEWSFWN